MLCGPPGTGKTEMAKYIAYKNNYLFAIIKKEDFISPFSGRSELNLANIVKQIEETAKKQPVVVLFDEIDSYIFSREGFALLQHEVNLVNSFLQHLESLNRTRNVIIFGTTNRYDALDNAAIRPGRFNYHKKVLYPDKQIITSYLESKLPLILFADGNSRKNIIELIMKTTCFSYSDLALETNKILELYIKTGKKISSKNFPASNTSLLLQIQKTTKNLISWIKKQIHFS